jgi:hypothetical protein
VSLISSGLPLQLRQKKNQKVELKKGGHFHEFNKIGGIKNEIKPII